MWPHVKPRARGAQSEPPVPFASAGADAQQQQQKSLHVAADDGRVGHSRSVSRSPGECAFFRLFWGTIKRGRLGGVGLCGWLVHRLRPASEAPGQTTGPRVASLGTGPGLGRPGKDRPRCRTANRG